MVTTTSNVTSFDQRIYQAISARANTHFRENAHSLAIPAAIIEPLDADEYKKPIFDQSIGVYGESEYGIDGNAMQTPKETKEHKLSVVRCNLYFDVNDYKKEGQYILQKKDDQLKEWARSSDLSIFSGVYKGGFNTSGAGQGTKLNDGIWTNATSVVDLNNTDSLMDAAGDIYKALTKMVASVPFAIRSAITPELYMNAKFMKEANGALFTYDNGMTEWEKFYDKYVTKGVPGFSISPNIHISDELFGNLGDTLGTHGRLALVCPDARICERAYSRGFGRLGQKTNEIDGTTEAWATKLAGCVHNADGVLLSEQITF